MKGAARSPDAWLGLFSRAAALGALGIGALVFVGGWLFGIAALRSLPLGPLVSMKANTALALAAAGLALVLLSEQGQGWRRHTGRLCALVPTLVGALTLAEYGLGGDLGVDELLFTDLDAVASQPPGRPALDTALTLLLIGLACATLTSVTRRGRRPADAFALSAGFVALVALFRPGFDDQLLVEVTPYTPMALPTTLALLLLAGSALTARPRDGVTRAVTDAFLGAAVSHELLTAGFVAALALTGLALWIDARQAARVEEVAAWVAHTHRAQGEMNRLLLLVAQAEESARGFATDGDPATHAAFEHDAARVPAQQRDVERLLSDDDRQNLLAALAPLIAQRLALSQRLVDLRRGSGPEAARAELARGAGEGLMSQIHAGIALMAARQRTQLDERSAAALRRARALRWVSIAAGVLSATLLVGVFSAALRENGLRRRGEQALREANEHLEEQVRERTRTLEQTVKELGASEQRFRTMVEAVSDYAIVLLDPEGRVATWNVGAQRLLGYDAGEIVGQHYSRFLLAVDAADGAADATLGVATRAGRFEDEGWRVRRDGACFWANVVVTPLFDDDGRLQGFSKITRDLTRERQARQALEASEERYRRVLDGMLEAAQILGYDWRYLYLNDAAARNGHQPKAEMLGRTMLERFPGIERTEMFAVLQRCMQERIATREEFEFTYPDGSTAWFDLSIQPAPEGLFILALDVTERKRMETWLRKANVELEQRVAERTRALDAANKELEAFSYSVSHDLRAPLRALDGFSQVLLEDQGARLDAAGRDCLARIRAAAQRMGRLIDDLLMLSRITQTELNRQAVNVSSVVQELVEELRQGEPGREVRVALEDDLVAHADPALLRVALGNLVGNAWKFTRTTAHALITFGAARDDGVVTYFVRDNGVGFDMVYADKLFTPFQRLHSARDFEGTGVGLAIVARVIRRHGGQVRAEAEVGRGATFHFTLEPGQAERSL